MKFSGGDIRDLNGKVRILGNRITTGCVPRERIRTTNTSLCTSHWAHRSNEIQYINSIEDEKVKEADEDVKIKILKKTRKRNAKGNVNEASVSRLLYHQDRRIYVYINIYFYRKPKSYPNEHVFLLQVSTLGKRKLEDISYIHIFISTKVASKEKQRK